MELSESERNAVDVLEKAMEHCGDSMVSGGREGGGRKEGRKEVAATVWSPHQKGQIETLESVQKLVLRHPESSIC